MLICPRCLIIISVARTGALAWPIVPTHAQRARATPRLCFRICLCSSLLLQCLFATSIYPAYSASREPLTPHLERRVTSQVMGAWMWHHPAGRISTTPYQVRAITGILTPSPSRLFTTHCQCEHTTRACRAYTRQPPRHISRLDAYELAHRRLQRMAELPLARLARARASRRVEARESSPPSPMCVIVTGALRLQCLLMPSHRLSDGLFQPTISPPAAECARDSEFPSTSLRFEPPSCSSRPGSPRTWATCSRHGANEKREASARRGKARRRTAYEARRSRGKLTGRPLVRRTCTVSVSPLGSSLVFAV